MRVQECHRPALQRIRDASAHAHKKSITTRGYNGDHMMNKAMNSCSLCQCIPCPFDYDVAFVALKAQENMVDTQKLSLAVHGSRFWTCFFKRRRFLLHGPGSKPITFSSPDVRRPAARTCEALL